MLRWVANLTGRRRRSQSRRLRSAGVIIGCRPIRSGKRGVLRFKYDPRILFNALPIFYRYDGLSPKIHHLNKTTGIASLARGSAAPAIGLLSIQRRHGFSHQSDKRTRGIGLREPSERSKRLRARTCPGVVVSGRKNTADVEFTKQLPGRVDAVALAGEALLWDERVYEIPA